MRLINRDTDYAIRALSYITHRENQIVSVSEIARELKIPRPFLRKILQILHKKVLLKSYEGRDGGFALAVHPDKIFLVDLIKIFQGPVKLVDCLFKKQICPDVSQCMLRDKIRYIEKLVATELKSITLSSFSKAKDQ